jgi:hypothetical protein
MNGLFFCILVIGSSVHCSAKKNHDGPPLFIRDIYTNGKPDPYFNKLLINIRKYYPILTEKEIVDCLEACALIKEDVDVIAECQELMLWKVTHLADIKDKKSCFKEYKQQ